VAVLKPRERLVYFRISEDEFRQFVSVCEQEGARSVSELARSAVQRLIADGQRHREGDELAEKMHKLDSLIAAVTAQLQLLESTRTGTNTRAEFIIPAHECCCGPNSVEANGRKEE
jgi:hypothetical protein